LIERGGRVSHRPTVNIGGMAPGVFALSPNKKFHRLRQRLLRSGVIYRQTPASAAANGATRAHEREREGERERKQTCAPPSMFTSSRRNAGWRNFRSSRSRSLRRFEDNAGGSTAISSLGSVSWRNLVERHGVA